MIRHVGRAALHGLAGALGALLVVLALTVWRLSGGPISLSFLSEHLAAALSGEAEGYSIRFEDTVLALGAWPRALDLRLDRVRILDDEGRVLMTAPEVSVGLSMARLMAGVIAPVRLEAVRPLLRIRRDAAGAITIGSPDADPAGSEGWAQLLADLGPRPDPDRPLARLDVVAVGDGTVLVEDARLGISWRAEHVDINVQRVTDQVRIVAAASLPFGEPDTHLDGVIVATRDDPRLAATLRFGGLRPDRIAQLSPELDVLAGFALAAGATLDLEFELDGGIVGAAFELWSGPGTVNPGGLYPEPKPITALALDGHLTERLGDLVIDSFALDLGDGELEGTASITGLGADEQLAVALTARELPASVIVDYWPPELGANVREWLAANLPEGIVTTGTLGLKAPLAAVGRDDSPLHALVVDLDVRAARLVWLAGMPAVEGASGRVRIGDFALAVDGLAGTSGGLALTDGRVSLPALDGAAGLTIETGVAGPLSVALALAGRPELGLAGTEAMLKGDIEALAEGTLAVALPRLTGIKRQDVGVTIAARLTRVTWPEVVPGAAIDDGTLDVTVEAGRARATGMVSFAGTPMAVTWDADVAGGGGARTTVRGTIDDAMRARLGLDLGDALTGLVEAALEIDETAARRFALDVDLANASVRLDAVDWTKPAGEPGHVTARWAGASGDGLALDQLVIEGGGLSFDGAATFDGAGGLAKLEATRVVLGANDLAGTVTRREDGGFDAIVSATSIDLSPYMERMTASREEQSLPAFRLDGTIAALYLRPDLALADVTVRADHGDERWRSLAFHGTLPNGAPLTISIGPVEGRRTFNLAAGDAGDALRLFDVFDDASGGTLEIAAQIDDGDAERPATGHLVMTDFTVKNAPILGKLLSLGSFTGMLAMLDGGGIPFTRANVPFVKRGAVVTIGGARAWGGAIGLNAEGLIDLDQDTLDLRGTLVPAYSVNSVLGYVPVLGDLLIGGEGEGLFAATYAIKGPRDDPQVLVNPLATLAPGFLREIFEFEAGPVPEGGVTLPQTEK